MQKGSKIQTQVDPVGEVEYKLIVQQAQESRTLSGAVATAAIGLMLDGMLRCKEAVAARWNDLQREEDGSGRLNFPFSKTDSTGRGYVVYVYPSTMKALDEMCGIKSTMKALDEMWGIKQELGMDSTDDRIFQMNSQQLARHIRNACEAAGLEGRFGSYSPIIGMIRDLALSGLSISISDVMRAARRPNPAMPVHSIQAGRWKNPAIPVLKYHTRHLGPSPQS